ncbi:MAG: hypothetical protein JEZ11_13785 [Desulfobacterales bacterium]|nr:hypothetical protein [Desulfobacterales bacterium]
METYPHRCRLLADILRGYLTQGMRLTPETVRFIDATVSVKAAVDLSVLLLDPDDSEADSLLELIFYPDLPMQKRIEDLLVAHRFTRKDPAMVVRSLSDPPIYARLIFPDNRGALTHRPAPAVLASMVDRLHISRIIAEPILAACRRFAPQTALNIRIQIRNAHTTPAENVTGFIATFLANADLDAGEILDCLRTALELTETIPDENISLGLIRIQRDLAEALDRADRLSRSASGQNMETLMLKGVRTPHINRAATEERMRRIDRLCRFGFDRVDHDTGAARVEDLGCFAPDRDLTDLVRRLS